VELEDIHAFVNLDPPVHILARRADGCGEEANEGRDPNGHVTSSRRDADKTSDGTRASTNNRELSLVPDILNRSPAENTEGGRSVGVEGGKHRADGTVERRTSVEAEPAEPNQDRTDEDERGIVGFAVDLVTLGQTLAENECICESRPSTGNVHRTAASKIQRWKIEQPSIGLQSHVLALANFKLVSEKFTYVPSPAGYGAVHNRRPAESEDH
jgi:hypothetical protein